MGDDPLSKPGMENIFDITPCLSAPEIVNRSTMELQIMSRCISEVPALFWDKYIPLDIAFIHVSPPDAHGFMSFGVECAASKAAAENAKIVIAQVNEKMPRTLGDVFIHVSRVNQIVECPDPGTSTHPIRDRRTNC